METEHRRKDGISGMKTHQLKLRIEFCDAVLSGEKSFEIRRNDRGFQRGDRIVFQAVERVDTDLIPCPHEINDVLFEIKYIMNGFGLENGFVVMAIEKIGRVEDERDYY